MEKLRTRYPLEDDPGLDQKDKEGSKTRPRPVSLRPMMQSGHFVAQRTHSSVLFFESFFVKFCYVDSF